MFSGSAIPAKKVSMGGKSQRAESRDDLIEKTRLERERRRRDRLEETSARLIQVRWQTEVDMMCVSSCVHSMSSSCVCVWVSSCVCVLPTRIMTGGMGACLTNACTCIVAWICRSSSVNCEVVLRRIRHLHHDLGCGHI